MILTTTVRYSLTFLRLRTINCSQNYYYHYYNNCGVGVPTGSCKLAKTCLWTTNHTQRAALFTSAFNFQEQKTIADVVGSEECEGNLELPIIASRVLTDMPQSMKPRQAWLEGLSTKEDEKLGLVDLHPDIFGYPPRIDIIHANAKWQERYKYINYDFEKSRAEMRGGGRKPWPQKGTGRARHGSIRSPIFMGGGSARGPRGPRSYYYELPTHLRVNGLRACLSVKYAQDDLHIVDSLDIPSEDPRFIEELFEERGWGHTALFIDDSDIMPRNITAATMLIKHFNLMPVYGLNCYSMLKHETLILTLAALEKIEKKLLTRLHSTQNDPRFKPWRN